MAEVNIVIQYVSKLIRHAHVKPSDIGVISLCKLQCEKIRSEARQRNFEGITIGTAEVFQGQEKAVIIISTVRSGKTMGFVKDKKVSQS